MAPSTSEARLELSVLRLMVRHASEGDPDAWEALYRHCHRPLFSYARRRLNGDEAAEDAVSEAMLRALERIQTFSWQGAGFDAWMYGIIRNVVLESHRQQTKINKLEHRESADIDLRQSVSGDSIWENMDLAAESMDLQEAFGSLNPDDQEILELRIVGGLSADQAASVLSKKPGAVRMAQSRALHRLRSAMRGHDDAR